MKSPKNYQPFGLLLIIYMSKMLMVNKMKFKLDTFERYLILIYLALLLVWHPWINSDGISYYAQVRSFFIDHDLQYANEFAHYRSVFEKKNEIILNQLGGISQYHPASVEESIFSPAEEKTLTGHTPNRVSIGPAILWAPFFLAGHILASLVDTFFQTEFADGYSLFYVIPVTWGTTIYGLLGLIFTFRLCRYFFSSKTALLAIIALWFATPLIYYMYLVPSMAHTLAFFTIALFIYFWWKWRTKYSAPRLFLLGLMAGLVVLVRWQNLFIIGLPLVDMGINRTENHVKKIIFLLSGFGIGCLPQIIIWKIIYGTFVLIPIGKETMNWTSPRILSVLFSSQHGFFLWNPIYLFCITGLFFLVKKQKLLTGFSLVFFLLEVYINSVPTNWYCGSSFGYRRLLDLLPFYALGLGYWVDKNTHQKADFAWILLFTLLSLWNMGFMVQFALGKISHTDPVNFYEVTMNQIFWLPAKLSHILGYLAGRLIP